MVYVSNAFSLQMLSADATIKVASASIEEVKKLLNTNEFVSAVGHADTANVISNILNMDIANNRINVSLNKNDALIVAQVVGGRLSEGATTLPEGVKIEFKLVTIV